MLLKSHGANMTISKFSLLPMVRYLPLLQQSAVRLLEYGISTALRQNDAAQSAVCFMNIDILLDDTRMGDK